MNFFLSACRRTPVICQRASYHKTIRISSVLHSYSWPSKRHISTTKPALKMNFFQNLINISPFKSYLEPTSQSGYMIQMFAIDMSCQLVGWTISSLYHTEKLYDLFGAGTFLLLTYLSWAQNGAATTIQSTQSALVASWAFRLGSHLIIRALKEGDKRFDSMKHDPKKFAIAWVLQGIWVFIVLSPTLLVNFERVNTLFPPILTNKIGWGLWIVGFAFEAIADSQKNAFRAEPANRNKFITTGLWGISRHPNYFGEILLWTGLFVSAVPALKGWQFLCVASPLFTAFLLTSVSGIPLLEKSADKKWGHLDTYQEYKRSTAILVPFLW